MADFVKNRFFFNLTHCLILAFENKHRLLKLIHQLGDTFDGMVKYFFGILISSNSKDNGSNFKEILIRPTIKSIV